MIGIVDYGMGNLFSVSKALERLNAPYFISQYKCNLMDADALLVPGVGSFRDAMKVLDRTGLTELIQAFADTGKPVLGICLGMQLLFEESTENGQTKGLNLLPGKVERFSGKTAEGEAYKVPHMGWNKLRFTGESPLLTSLEEDYVYFVHSYYVKTNESGVLVAVGDYYDVEVPAIVGRNNIYGMQFHPEKSSDMGMALLRNFANLATERKTEE
ncbi:imidazole glycerol phosphate synthase subunit HisH [Mesobacillus selenatarsenatis]|uniref:Imidazole glycerol phosphate synthase subunit HisH n=1 Tax=Mesobacillus selenatarsenatis (strain DSM 18680 / JCM 14380 / FERM P-15431 / SF-1) TaxID=1321606 RepID=A0A0A8XCE9_MESS1|nr:imidazole glycerol phosphate synthase subunit HisH [Mesobacillus selenatarsenatis]GAM15831.1 imidazole glycerol phosphate synthase amidotransferase subunit [Mesobacillus selenatarsenatis SF-1]